MTRLLSSVLLLFALGTSLAEAQRRRSAPRCTRGVQCGNTCIAANKTCRIGTAAPAPAPPPARATSASATTGSATDSAWVASSRGSMYYRRGCKGAGDLAPQNLIYFRSEEAAQRAGYRRSVQKGC